MKLSLVSPEFVRFLVVGISNFVVSFVVFTLAYRWSLGDNFVELLKVGDNSLKELLWNKGITSVDGFISQCLAYIVGTANSYLWNTLWTFRQSFTKSNVIKFCVLNLANLALSASAIFVLVDVQKNNATLSWLLVMIVVTLTGFIGSKYWVFKK